MKQKTGRALILDLDGTIYRLVGPKNEYSGSKLEKIVLKNSRTFIKNRNLVESNKIDSLIQAGLKDPVGLSAYIEANYEIPRSMYFSEVWDINPEGVVTDYNDSVSALYELSRQNTLILLTSSAKVWQEKVCRYLGISTLFAEIYTGEDFTTKDEVFSLLCSKYKKNKITSVGDQLKTDIEPAKAIGLGTLWIKEPKEITKLL